MVWVPARAVAGTAFLAATAVERSSSLSGFGFAGIANATAHEGPPLPTPPLVEEDETSYTYTFQGHMADWWGVRGLFSIPGLFPFTPEWFFVLMESQISNQTSSAEATTEGKRGERQQEKKTNTEGDSHRPWLFSAFWKLAKPIVDRLGSLGLLYCGTLCTSIGLAAKWAYWLLVGIVGVFLLQLAVWTYTWVVYPTVVHSRALLRYCRGETPWSEVSRLLGDRPFRPNWRGPATDVAWTANYVQSEVRGRGPNRLPYDLLVSDGTAIARLRHGTIRGRTNRHGFVCAGEEVRSSSHRYFRNLIEAAECKVHLCSQRPCTAMQEHPLHVAASAIVPQSQELDLQDLAGRGPWARCALLTWFFGLLWCRCCRQGTWRVTRSLGRCCGWVLCYRSRRGSLPEDRSSLPRHDESETESEADCETACQADQIAMALPGKDLQPLASEPCRDVARGNPEVLLKADEAVSCQEGLLECNGEGKAFHSCDYHRALYRGSQKGRTCSVEGCLHAPSHSRGGVRLCKLHAAKDEKKPRTGAKRAGQPPALDSSLPQPPDSPYPLLPRTQGFNGEKELEPACPFAPKKTVLLKGILQRIMAQESPVDACRGTFMDCFSRLPNEVEFQEVMGLTKASAEEYLAQVAAGDQPLVVDALQTLVAYPVGDNYSRDEVMAMLRPGTPVSADAIGNEVLPPLPPTPSLLEDLRGNSTPSGSRITGPVRFAPELTGRRVAPPTMTQVPETRPFPMAGDTLPAPSQELPLAQSLMRKKGPSAASPMHLSQVPTPEWFRAGAYTNPVSGHPDDTTRALQAIAKAVGAKDEASAQERGKLSSIGRTEERALFLARGCDSLSVPLGEATVGKELFHALRNTATQDRPLLRSLKFPINITNRFAFGVCSLCIGGKGSLPDYALCVGDFPATSEEDFDFYSTPGDVKLEKKPRSPSTLTLWFRNALRQAWSLACVLGIEHYSSWEKAAGQLLKYGEEQSHMWPMHLVLSVWEELWGRFCEEIRDLERKARREMAEDSPSFERLRFFCTAPGADGNPWLRLPQTFDLDDSLEYFQTDVLPRQRRALDRACWNLALRKQPPLLGGKAGEDTSSAPGIPGAASAPGPKVGASPDPLIGKPLSGKEVQRSMDHRPKCSKTGKYLCWDHISRRGCKAASCPHSHEGGIPAWQSLDWSIKMQLLRRGGHPQQPKPSHAGDVDKQISAIRKEQADKLAASVAEGKARAKNKPKSKSHPSPKVGSHGDDANKEDTRAGWAKPPPELGNFCATDMEAGLDAVMKGQGPDWTADHGPKPLKHVGLQSHTPETMERNRLMQEVEKSELVPQEATLLGTYLRNRLLHAPHRPPQAQDVQQALDDALAKGCPELVVEVEEYLAKVGDSSARRAQLTPTVWSQGQDRPGSATLTWGDHAWEVFDYGDTLQLSAELKLSLQPSSQPHSDWEPRQCLVLHIAAALLWSRSKQLPSWSEVQTLASRMRGEFYVEADKVSEALGELPPWVTRAERDLRVFVHDFVYFGHDKDYRSLAAFPPEELASVAVHVVRLDAWKRPTVEALTGCTADTRRPLVVWLLVYDGHMRLLVPTSRTVPAPARSIGMHGWEVHLEAAAASGAQLVAPAKCPRCEVSELRRTGVANSVLGLYPLAFSDPQRTGEVAWEPDSPNPPHFSRADLEAFFAGQEMPPAGQPLHLLELYAGAARASIAVRDAGGWALSVGLDHGHDLRRARDRALVRYALDILSPLHVLLSFPCRAFCAWARLNATRSVGHSATLIEGRRHLAFAMSVGRAQLQAGRHVTAKNPLTSSAWREPEAISALEGMHRVRVDQCAEGLRGPDGPHLKPVLLRTSSACVAAAFSLRREGDHASQPVAGSALGPSAVYPGMMASLLAAAVLEDGGGKGRGGGRAAFSRCKIGLENRFGPKLEGEFGHQGHAPPSDSPPRDLGSTKVGRSSEPSPYCLQHGPLAPDLDPQVREAAQSYLSCVEGVEFSKEALSKAAATGTQLLKASGGWQEAIRAIKRLTVEKHGDHFESLHAGRLDGLVPQAILQRAKDVALWGVDACVNLQQSKRVKCAPHPSLKAHLDEAAQQLWKDATKGRVLICDDEEGSCLLEGVVSVPMARVPKMLPDRTVSESGRVVWDATPVNQFCGKEDYPPALQPRHNEVARAILWWKLRLPGVPILLSKKDVSDAFKWVPVRLEDSKFFASDLPGSYTERSCDTTLVYGFMTFGWRGAPGEYMGFAWVLKLAHGAHGPSDTHWELPSVAFHSFVLMDDTVLIEPDIGLRPWVSVETSEHVTRQGGA